MLSTTSNLAFAYPLPSQVHVLISDPETGKRYGGFVDVKYLNETALITCRSIGELREGCTPFDIADRLLREKPGMPLLCDSAIAEELGKNPMDFVDDQGHYRMQIRPGGILKIYTAFDVSVERISPEAEIHWYEKPIKSPGED
jgi:hypothetical protein